MLEQVIQSQHSTDQQATVKESSPFSSQSSAKNKTNTNGKRDGRGSNQPAKATWGAHLPTMACRSCVMLISSSLVASSTRRLFVPSARRLLGSSCLLVDSMRCKSHSDKNACENPTYLSPIRGESSSLISFNFLPIPSPPHHSS